MMLSKEADWLEPALRLQRFAGSSILGPAGVEKTMTELEQRQAVVDEAMSWIHTPYHECADIKHVGVDCALILMRVYSAVGLVEFVDPRPYSPQWHIHHAEEIYLSWLERMGAREVSQGKPGDIAMFKWGRAWSHGAIIVEPHMVIHSYVGSGVMLSRLTEAPLDGRPPRFWSLWSH